MATNEYDAEYRKIQKQTVADLEKLYNIAAAAVLAGIPLHHLSANEVFAFKNYKKYKKLFDEASAQLTKDVIEYINNSTKKVWDISTAKNDKFVDSEYAKLNLKAPDGLKKGSIDVYEKLKSRKIKDLTISDRVWNINNTGFKQQIEQSINAAIESGKSAKRTSRDVRRYLNNPDALFRRIRDSEGRMQLSANALRYNPGRGVYRSAYMNAVRLARNEINLFYREADYERWNRLDFIIGYKIQNSNRIATVCPVCLQFNGKVFPKSVKFTGFHVQCMCTALPVKCPEEEFKRIARGEKLSPKQPEIPKEYKEFADGELL
jgi:hypothetical protein